MVKLFLNFLKLQTLKFYEYFLDIILIYLFLEILADVKTSFNILFKKKKKKKTDLILVGNFFIYSKCYVTY